MPEYNEKKFFADMNAAMAEGEAEAFTGSPESKSLGLEDNVRGAKKMLTRDADELARIRKSLNPDFNMQINMAKNGPLASKKVTLGLGALEQDHKMVSKPKTQSKSFFKRLFGR